MPRQDLDPRPKGWRYFSNLFLSAASTSHRSGMKDLGEGNMEGFSCVSFWVVDTGVPAGIL